MDFHLPERDSAIHRPIHFRKLVPIDGGRGTELAIVEDDYAGHANKSASEVGAEYECPQAPEVWRLKDRRIILGYISHSLPQLVLDAFFANASRLRGAFRDGGAAK